MNKYQNMIDKVLAGEIGKEKLQTLLSNSRRKSLSGDLEAAAVEEVCEDELQKYAPKAAFSDQVRIALEELVDQRGWAKNQGNVLSNRIKFSGSVLGGVPIHDNKKVVAAHYVGFKPKGARRQAGFELFIREKGDPIRAVVWEADGDSGTMYQDVARAADAYDKLLKKYVAR